MNKPVSQFITDRGCIVQGVMKDENEKFYIYCPEHKEMEHVYSFSREIDFRKDLHPKVKALIERLKKEHRSSLGGNHR